MVFELDFFDKTVKGTQILHINSYEWLNSDWWFEVGKELFLYLLMKEVDEVNSCRQFWVLLFRDVYFLVGRVDWLGLAAWNVAHGIKDWGKKKRGKVEISLSSYIIDYAIAIKGIK
jgi:hypothetical protein